MRRFRKPAFAVRQATDSSRGSWGIYVDDNPYPNLRVKYYGEYEQTRNACPAWQEHLRTLQTRVLLRGIVGPEFFAPYPERRRRRVAARRLAAVRGGGGGDGRGA